MNAKKASALLFTALILAVSMSYIDITIVSIAVPDIQKDLQLTATGAQWLFNAYLLALSAFFLIGGRLGDTLGHRKLITVGIVVFIVASALCGLAPESGIGEGWIICARAIQGAGAALMLPSALAMVINSYDISQLGTKLAVFFGITGAVTCLGPLAGGILLEIDWRAIFWVNVPIGLGALWLLAISKPTSLKVSAPFDWLGAVLSVAGMALLVLGLQEAGNWGWGAPETWGSIVAGALLIAAFVVAELRSRSPLARLGIFSDRTFSAESAVQFLLSIAFVPLLFFASTYAQMALGDTPGQAALYITWFFVGFATSNQIGGRILDKIGARATILPGALICAAGFYFWSRELTGLDVDTQRWFILVAGIGMGLMYGPAGSHAMTRAPAGSYAEVSALGQLIRNLGGSVGLGVLGSILVVSADGGQGVSAQLAYAQATQTVFYILAALMVVTFVVGFLTLRRGRVDEVAFSSPQDSRSRPSQ
ncbi:MAG: MFS transporter [Actinomycetota bacterium]